MAFSHICGVPNVSFTINGRLVLLTWCIVVFCVPACHDWLRKREDIHSMWQCCSELVLCIKNKILKQLIIQVCRRWRFLCSRQQLWIDKCNQLGVQYCIPHLSERILEETGEMTIDWQTAYHHIDTVLKRCTTEWITTSIHPAVRAKRDYS